MTTTNCACLHFAIICIAFGSTSSLLAVQVTQPPGAVGDTPAPQNPAPVTGTPSSQPPASAGGTPAGAAPGSGAAAGQPPQGTPAPPPGAELIRERYRDGSVRVERYVIQDAAGNYVNHGPWTAFYPGGTKIGGGAFEMGKRQGKWTRQFARGEGQILAAPSYQGFVPPFRSEAVFVNGEINGPWIIFDSRGTRASEWHFKAGKQHGDWIWYTPNGQKARHVVYVNGVQNGKTLEWGADGKVNSTVEYLDGRRREFKVGFYQPNVKHWEGFYLHPKEVTKTQYDWWLGEASTHVANSQGPPLRDGKWTWWFPNSQTRTEGVYRDGKPDGKWTWWHPNGQKWSEGVYVLGKKTGKWTSWNPSGVVESTEDFPAISSPAAAGTGGAPVTNGQPTGNAPGTSAGVPSDAPAGAQAAPPANSGGSGSAIPSANTPPANATPPATEAPVSGGAPAPAPGAP